MVNGIQLLDCTLRDGAHLNHGNFGKKTISHTVSGLVQSNLDIIEIGFFTNDTTNEDLTFFNSIADAKRALPADKGTSKFSLMADFVDVSQVEPCDGTIEFFRLSFKRHRLDWGLSAASTLMKKGYKCYINPVNCTVYSKEEYLEVINQVNQLKPYGFSIVDTFGVLRKQTLSDFYTLAEENLDPDITIGLHLHENLGLAYSLAQHFLEIRNPRRNITIDCSLFGMGRVPGNLCTEQIMEHLNSSFDHPYNIEPAYDLIDDYIAPIKREIPWGYSLPYALSGKFGVHRTYAEFLIGKHRLKTKDIQRILSSIDKNHIEMFDEAYIEALYRQYISVEYEDTASIIHLTELIENKRVLIVCPGHSITHHKHTIQTFCAQDDVITISVNFLPSFCKPDIAFCANAKRLENIQNTSVKRFITSNLIELAKSGFHSAFSFNNCAYFNDFFCEDSTLMLLKILDRCNCRCVFIAGFDGFERNAANYYTEHYTHEQGNYISSATVKRILKESLQHIDIRFLTPSAYA